MEWLREPNIDTDTSAEERVNVFLRKHSICSTSRIAQGTKISTNKARRILYKMEKDGLVFRTAYSQKRNIIWTLGL